ncbi:MAG: type II toxin-antitoxin system VapC family toxin [Pseudomonadota bacterium]|nr:type II toxin-antitoxin system VapC family toxin [Pseudomonadota bacterium]
MRFVLDNSVVMRWLFQDGTPEAMDYARHILDLLTKEDGVALTPCIWALEVGNVIARAESRGLLQEARSAEFLGILNDMAIDTDVRSTAQALGDTLQLARRYKLSTYDAAYLELALREGLPLATNDEALRKALAVAGGRLA